MNIRAHSLRSLIVIAATIALVPTLSSCSFEIVNGSAEPTGDAPQVTEPSDGEQSERLDRSVFDAMVSMTVECGSGSADVDEAGGVIRVDGDCADLGVSSAGSVVLAGAVETLTVDGTGNTVFVDEAKKVELAGTGNTVVWSTGTPEVSDIGVGNTAVSSGE